MELNESVVIPALVFEGDASRVAVGDFEGTVPRIGETVKVPQGTFEVVGVSYEYGPSPVDTSGLVLTKVIVSVKRLGRTN